MNLKNTLAGLCYSIVLCVLLLGCQNTKKENSDKNESSIQDTVVYYEPIDTLNNNIARLIGGIDTAIMHNQGILYFPFLKEYSLTVTSKVQKIKESRLDPITAWNKENLQRNGIEDSSFVFYPFSGGDFIHIYSMYPNAKEYLMVAREDVGDLPPLHEKDTSFIKNYLKDVDTVLRDIYNKSYFITKNMIEDTKKNTLVNGMLPTIVWAAAITGHEIMSLRYVDMDSTGNLTDYVKTADENKPDGIEIGLISKIGKVKRKITYLSCDISNSGFEKNKQFYTYISNKVPEKCNSFIKSASYLLHYNSFSKIRGLITSKSKYLVQDDTGIPYKYFDNNWKIELFGVYEKPVSDFKADVYQNDLQIAYTDSSQYRGTLPFSLGYHWSSRKQNQMVFIRKN